ncbi:hypothetical protein [Streptococcus fryi]
MTLTKLFIVLMMSGMYYFLIALLIYGIYHLVRHYRTNTKPSDRRAL